MILHLCLISAIYAYCYDVSGGWREITTALCSWLTHGKIKQPIRIKPFSCAVCMTFWTCIAYCAIFDTLSVPNIALSCLMSYCVDIWVALLYCVKDKLLSLINTIQQYERRDNRKTEKV